MNQYSIKDLERLSGIKAHTLRIWEQRYKIVEPKRTPTNIRYYSDDDLRRILNISLLNQNSFKISHIAKMTDDEMFAEVIRLTGSDSSINSQIDILTLCMVEVDEERFEKVMSGNILRHGFEKTMVNIIFPFLEKVGYMWMTGTINPAQEHFISNLIRQKLIVAIDGQVINNTSKEGSYMLFCPEKEFHEIGLLFMNYLLRTRKCKTIYLGAAVPMDDVELIYDIHKPAYLLVHITIVPDGWDIQQYVEELAKKFPQSTLLISGQALSAYDLALPKNATYIDSTEKALDHIDRSRHGSDYFSVN